MKIILEGVDGVGKTSLALKLAKTLNLEYQHDSAPRSYEEYWKELNNGIPRVYDRFFFGQFAGYQSDKERLLTYPELYSLINFAKENSIMIIVCHDKVESIAKRFKYNNSDKFWMEKVGVSSVEDFIERIQKGFMDVAKLGGKAVHFLDMRRIVRVEKDVPRDYEQE
jgi:thymidylate kinase